MLGARGSCRGGRRGAEPIGVGAGGMSRKEASRSFGGSRESRARRGDGGGHAASRALETNPHRTFGPPPNTRPAFHMFTFRLAPRLALRKISKKSVGLGWIYLDPPQAAPCTPRSFAHSPILFCSSCAFLRPLDPESLHSQDEHVDDGRGRKTPLRAPSSFVILISSFLPCPPPPISRTLSSPHP
jgi:hypothetical protein